MIAYENQNSKKKCVAFKNLLQFLNLHDCTFNWNNNNKNIATL